MEAEAQDLLLLQALMPGNWQGPHCAASALVSVGLRARLGPQHVAEVAQEVQVPLAPRSVLVRERKSENALTSPVSMVVQLEEAVHTFVADHLGLASLPRDH